MDGRWCTAADPQVLPATGEAGTATLGSSGTYAITYQTNGFDENGYRTRKRAFRCEYSARQTSCWLNRLSKVAASNSEVIDLTVGELAAGRRVFGTVLNPLGLPIAGMEQHPP